MYPAVLLMYFISAAVILLASLARDQISTLNAGYGAMINNNNNNNIALSVLREVHTHLQSEFFILCDLVLSLSSSRTYGLPVPHMPPTSMYCTDLHFSHATVLCTKVNAF